MPRVKKIKGPRIRPLFFWGGVKCTPHRCIKTKGQYNPKIHQGQLPNHQSHKHHNKPRISRFFNYIANLSIRERIPQAPFKKLVEIVEETFFQHKPMILMFLGIYCSLKWLSWKEHTYPKCNVPFKWYVAHLIGLTIRLGAHVHNTYHQGWWINKSNINLNLH